MPKKGHSEILVDIPGARLSSRQPCLSTTCMALNPNCETLYAGAIEVSSQVLNFNFTLRHCSKDFNSDLHLHSWSLDNNR